MEIRIVIGGLSIEGTLYETPTARKVVELLPFRAKFNTWGEEIYFEIPVDEDLDDSASEEVDVGDLGYWPTGNAFCIFAGPTPVSRAGKILPASAVNVIGKVTGDVRRFKEVLDEREVRLEPIAHYQAAEELPSLPPHSGGNPRPVCSSFLIASSPGGRRRSPL